MKKTDWIIVVKQNKVQKRPKKSIGGHQKSVGKLHDLSMKAANLASINRLIFREIEARDFHISSFVEKTLSYKLAPGV